MSAPQIEAPVDVARFRDGDMAALAEVFRLYGGRIYRLARHMLGNHADAEDATQEIFIRAFEQRRRYHANSALYTWLYRVGIHHCLNMIRKRRRLRYREQQASIGPEVADPQAPDALLESLSQGEQRQVADQLLQMLPAQYRACLILRESEGLSYAEIAALLEVPTGTVMSRLNRARAVLRERLTASGGQPPATGNNPAPAVVEEVGVNAR